MFYKAYCSTTTDNLYAFEDVSVYIMMCMYVVGGIRITLDMGLVVYGKPLGTIKPFLSRYLFFRDTKLCYRGMKAILPRYHAILSRYHAILPR